MLPRRPIRIANCSGAHMDPGYHMLRQATAGDVDAITGDYLAEMNIANNAQAIAKGSHPGYELTALDGLLKTISVIEQKRIKVVVNGGALNPKGLAEEVQKHALEKKLDLQIAWVEGDNLMDTHKDFLRSGEGLVHLDSDNKSVNVHKSLTSFVDSPKNPIVSANAYLGARGIVKALQCGVDIVICGRVADASPVIGLAQWWHGWSVEDYDCLAGALIAGHLIECSGYVTGSNFSASLLIMLLPLAQLIGRLTQAFTKFPLETFIDIGYGIAEVASSGDCVITKHETLNGMVNEDTVRAQLLYELQGEIYLNNDVKADLSNITVREEALNRVHVSGTKGYPPPPTTKFAVFHQGGWQNELWIGLTGSSYEVEKKKELIEKQVRYSLKKAGIENRVDTLEFQLYGRPQQNAVDECAGTSLLRIFAQAGTQEDLRLVSKGIVEFSIGMQHVSGMHLGDIRTLRPKSFLVYYPAIVSQSVIKEVTHLLPGRHAPQGCSVLADPIRIFESLKPRRSYETANPVDLSKYGRTVVASLGSMVLARSGDKGGNMNVGFFVHGEDEYDWLRTVMKGSQLQKLLGGDWKDEYHIERCRGVSSSTILDSLGKGFADYLRNKLSHIPHPLHSFPLVNNQKTREMEIPEVFLSRPDTGFGKKTVAIRVGQLAQQNAATSWPTSTKIAQRSRL